MSFRVNNHEFHSNFAECCDDSRIKLITRITFVQYDCNPTGYANTADFIPPNVNIIPYGIERYFR